MNQLIVAFMCLWIFAGNAFGQDDFRLRTVTVFSNNIALCEMEGTVKTDKGSYHFTLPNGMNIADVHLEGDIRYVKNFQDDSLKYPTDYTALVEVLRANINKSISFSIRGASYSGRIKSVNNNQLWLICPQLVIVPVDSMNNIRINPSEHKQVEVIFNGKSANQFLKVSYLTNQMSYKVLYEVDLVSNSQITIIPFIELSCEDQLKNDNVVVHFSDQTVFNSQTSDADYQFSSAFGLIKNKKSILQPVSWWSTTLNLSQGISHIKGESFSLPVESLLTIGSRDVFKHQENLTHDKIPDWLNAKLSLSGYPGSINRWEYGINTDLGTRGNSRGLVSNYDVTIRDGAIQPRNNYPMVTNNFTPDTVYLSANLNLLLSNNRPQTIPAGRIGLFSVDNQEKALLGNGAFSTTVFRDSAVVLCLPEWWKDLHGTRYSKQIWKKEFVKAENGKHFDSIYVECKYDLVNKSDTNLKVLLKDIPAFGGKVYFTSEPILTPLSPNNNRNLLTPNAVMFELRLPPKQTKTLTYRYRYLVERVR